MRRYCGATAHLLVFRVCLSQLHARLTTICENNPTLKQGLADSLDSLWTDLLPDFKVDDFSKSQIDKTVAELKQERDTVRDLLP
jgi:hypothetical protein